jgi:hypothetical protein
VRGKFTALPLDGCDGPTATRRFHQIVPSFHLPQHTLHISVMHNPLHELSLPERMRNLELMSAPDVAPEHEQTQPLTQDDGAPPLCIPDLEPKITMAQTVDDLNHPSDAIEGQRSPSSPGSMTLEGLPAELRLQILMDLSDVADLQAVVLASPVFHRQYLLDRQKVLGQVLETTMAGAFVEAYAVHISTRLPEPGYFEQKEAVIERFLEEYRVLRSDPGAVTRQCALEDLLGMATYYREVIQPLVEYYSALFLSRLGTTGSPSQESNLSGTERVRFLRSFYRFQLYTTLFCSTTTLYSLTQHFSDMYILTTFFDMYKPWEAEEIACVSLWVMARYRQAFEAVRWHVYREHPGHGQWESCYAPPGVYPNGVVVGVSSLSTAVRFEHSDR